MKRFVCFFAFVVLLVCAAGFPVYGELAVGPGTVSASIESVQRFVSYRTPLNPDAVFGSDEGYLGSFRYTAGYDVSGDRFSFTLNDYGTFDADENPDGRNCLGELFGTVRLGEVFLDAGKKRINQSPSYYESPINFALDDYREYDLTYSEGRVMVNLEWFSPAGFFGVSYLPRLAFPAEVERYVTSSQDRQALARYEVSGEAGSLGLVVSRDDRWRAGVHGSRTFGQYTEAHVELVWDEDERMKQVTGVTVNLPWISVIAEYFYNQAGLSAREWDDERDRYRQLTEMEPLQGMALYNLGRAYGTFTGNQGYNGRHYALLRVSNPADGDWDLSFTTTMNLQDFGFIILPELAYSGWHNLVMTLRFMRCFGPHWSEYMLYGELWSGELSVELWL